MSQVGSSTAGERVSLERAAMRVVLIGAIVFGLEVFFEANRLVSLVLGMTVVEFLGAKLGLSWGDERPVDWRSRVLRGISGGVVGIAVVFLSMVPLMFLDGVQVALGKPSALGIGLAIGMAVVQAARDELLYRGLPRAVLRGRVTETAVVGYSALLGLAPTVLLPGATVTGGVLTLVLGLVTGLAWRFGRGAFLAVGLHAGVLFASGGGSKGLVLDVMMPGALVPLGKAEGGVAVVVAVLLLAVFAYGLWRMRRTTLVTQ